jgi:putative tryptophan/tyrosine transport system substrate-binding protein
MSSEFAPRKTIIILDHPLASRNRPGHGMRKRRQHPSAAPRALRPRKDDILNDARVRERARVSGKHMRRRDFIALLGSAAVALPLAARAQHSERMRRIGILFSNAEEDPQAHTELDALRQELQQLGWTEGRSVHFDYRWAAGDVGLMRTFAKQLVDQQPDVIVARSTPATEAIVRESRTIPVVFTTVSDPIGSGFIASLAHPGNHITGFTNFEASMAGKWLQLIKEIAPHITRAAIIFNPEAAPFAPYYIGPFEAAAHSSAVEPIVAPVRDAADIERSIAALAREPNGALIMLPDAFTTTAIHYKQIVDLAAGSRTPAIYPYRFIVSEGGLISYGVNVVDIYRRAASYVDRILKGAKPADLPVQQPSKFELAINLKTANALGLTVPLTLQASADQVIE